MSLDTIENGHMFAYIKKNPWCLLQILTAMIVQISRCVESMIKKPHKTMNINIYWLLRPVPMGPAVEQQSKCMSRMVQHAAESAGPESMRTLYQSNTLETVWVKRKTI